MDASDLKKLLIEFEVLEALHRLPDSVALTTDEAAIFLRISPTTLERMRKDKSGPNYIQFGKVGAKGTNQKCTYLKSELIRYRESLKVSCSLDAAIRRGQAFMPYMNPTPKRSDYDLTTKRPFYLNANGRLIIGSVGHTPLDVIISRLGKCEIAWLNPIFAASQVWVSVEEHKIYADSVRASLTFALSMINESAPE